MLTSLMLWTTDSVKTEQNPLWGGVGGGGEEVYDHAIKDLGIMQANTW